MSKISFHRSFKLNGNSFSSDIEVLEYSKNLDISIYQFLVDWFSLDDFIEVQTSGSTGKPKLIQLKKKFMKNSAQATGKFFNLFENSTALLCLSTNYIAGKMMFVRALTLGWNLDVVELTSEVKINKKYDFSAMVPLQLRNSLSKVYRIKKLIVGGGVVANDLIQQIQKVPSEIFATYGMTETITHIAAKKLNNLGEFVGQSQNETYKTLPSIGIYIDHRSCLCIKADKISDEFIVTNDVVQLISDSQFEWLGRYDNVVNSGGVKLHPEKIEEKLSKIIKSRFFVIGIPDEVLGERLVLIIEGKKKDIILSEVNLFKYEIPKEIYFVRKFVETETKKIQRKKTLDLLNL